MMTDIPYLTESQQAEYARLYAETFAKHRESEDMEAMIEEFVKLAVERGELSEIQATYCGMVFAGLHQDELLKQMGGTTTPELN